MNKITKTIAPSIVISLATTLSFSVMAKVPTFSVMDEAPKVTCIGCLPGGKTPVNDLKQNDTKPPLIIEESTSIVELNGNMLFVHQDRESFSVHSTKGNSFKISAVKSDPDLREVDVIRVKINQSVEHYPVDDFVVNESTYEAYQALVDTDIGEFLKLKEDSSVLFSVSTGEAVGCAGAGLLVGSVTAGWGGAIVAGACIAWANDNSVEVD